MRMSDWSSDVCSSDLGLLPIDDANALAARLRLADMAWRIGFGAISWPWLLASLSGGRKADKRALLDELGLPHDALPHLGSWRRTWVSCAISCGKSRGCGLPMSWNWGRAHRR